MSEPKWLTIARGELGTKEAPGPANNPRVVQYYEGAVGRKHPDSVPWCAAFCCWALWKAGKKGWGNLLARGALAWGRKLSSPKIGCIVVFPRGKSKISGHVAFVEGFDALTLTVIEGNKNDMVIRGRYARSRAIGYRWPA